MAIAPEVRQTTLINRYLVVGQGITISREVNIFFPYIWDGEGGHGGRRLESSIYKMSQAYGIHNLNGADSPAKVLQITM